MPHAPQRPLQHEHGTRMAIWFWRQQQMPASGQDGQELDWSVHTTSLELSFHSLKATPS